MDKITPEEIRSKMNIEFEDFWNEMGFQFANNLDKKHSFEEMFQQGFVRGIQFLLDRETKVVK